MFILAKERNIGNKTKFYRAFPWPGWFTSYQSVCTKCKVSFGRWNLIRWLQLNFHESPLRGWAQAKILFTFWNRRLQNMRKASDCFPPIRILCKIYDKFSIVFRGRKKTFLQTLSIIQKKARGGLIAGLHFLRCASCFENLLSPGALHLKGSLFSNKLPLSDFLEYLENILRLRPRKNSRTFKRFKLTTTF